MARLPSLNRVLGWAIGAVFTLAVTGVLVDESASPSHAATPPPPVHAALPATVRTPAPAPVHPQSPPRGAPAATRVANTLSTAWGIDLSWPQCGPVGMPRVQPGFVVVGLTGGRPFTGNPCLGRELAFARTQTGYAAYLNIDAPRSGDAAAYGRRVALDALARAGRVHLGTPTFWLDVEILNHWGDPATNVAVINAALHTLQAHAITAGIYSSQPMWQEITSGADPGVPVWLATSVTDYRQLTTGCAQGLGGRPATMAQYVATDGRQLVDVDVLCTGGLPDSVRMFSAGR